MVRLIALSLVFSFAASEIKAEFNADATSCRLISKARDRLACYDKAYSPTKDKGEPRSIDAQADSPDIRLALMGDREQCNPQELYNKIKSALPEKDQFETTNAFEAKREKAIANISIKIKNVLCQATPQHLLRYNADNKEIRAFFLGPKSIDIVRDEGEYQGQNAYGATTKIRRLAVDSFEIFTDYLTAEFYAPLSPEVAKAQFKDLMMGAVGDIRPPYTSEESHQTTPTISQPEDKRTLAHRVHFKPKAIVLYNQNTKEILWSSPVSECKEYSWSTSLTTKIGKC